MELRAQVHVTCEVLAEGCGGCVEGKCVQGALSVRVFWSDVMNSTQSRISLVFIVPVVTFSFAVTVNHCRHFLLLRFYLLTDLFLYFNLKKKTAEAPRNSQLCNSS